MFALRNLLYFLLLAVLATFALGAATEQKPVIVSYPKETPDYIVEEAMEAVRKAGGIITHEYHLIKGFAAKASDEALSLIQSMSEGEHSPTVEDDQVMSIAEHD